MQFILTSGWDDGVADLSQRLVHELAEGKRVLWLVSGGSNIPASVQAMDAISTKLSSKLRIMPADERYGEPGHSDSNEAQLLDAGLSLKKAQFSSILEIGKTLEQTVVRFKKLAAEAFEKAEVVIAQLGIGEDGHVAGILPNSPATEENSELVSGYTSDPHERLTLTFPALKQVSIAYAFAFGEAKRPALTALRDQDLDLVEQPAQILKQLPLAYLYNDQIGVEA